MRRASHNITLVLISASLVLHGCGSGSSVTYVPVYATTPAGTNPTTLPGTTPTTYRYEAPYYYAQIGSRPVYGTGYSSGYGSGYRGYSSGYHPGYRYRSGGWGWGGWGGGGWSGGRSGGGWSSGSSGGTVHHSSTPSVSRGGFGSSAHSVSSGHSSGIGS